MTDRKKSRLTLAQLNRELTLLHSLLDELIRRIRMVEVETRRLKQYAPADALGDDHD